MKFRKQFLILLMSFSLLLTSFGCAASGTNSGTAESAAGGADSGMASSENALPTRYTFRSLSFGGSAASVTPEMLLEMVHSHFPEEVEEGKLDLSGVPYQSKDMIVARVEQRVKVPRGGSYFRNYLLECRYRKNRWEAARCVLYDDCVLEETELEDVVRIMEDVIDDRRIELTLQEIDAASQAALDFQLSEVFTGNFSKDEIMRCRDSAVTACDPPLFRTQLAAALVQESMWGKYGELNQASTLVKVTFPEAEEDLLEMIEQYLLPPEGDGWVFFVIQDENGTWRAAPVL